MSEHVSSEEKQPLRACYSRLSCLLQDTACIGGFLKGLDIVEERVEVYAAHGLKLPELCLGRLEDEVKERKGLAGRHGESRSQTRV